MGLPAELTAVMQMATYNAFTGQDQWGNNTYGADYMIKVRLEGQTTSMMTSTADAGATGPDETQTVRLIADYISPSGVAAKGRVTVNGLTYRVTEVVTHYDEHGPYYQELTCSTNMER